jgi:mRNA interferase MazF
VVIVSATTFNQGPRELVVVLPITRTRRNAPLHIEIAASESGLPDTSYVMAEQIRSISTGRILGRLPVGVLSRSTMDQIQDRLIALLDIDVL